MPLLSAKSRAALAGLFCAVNGACDNSRREDTARMDRSRLKFYQDNFCQHHGINDPCLLQILSHHEVSLIFACYAVFLALGHTLWCKTIKSATITNYLHTAANHVGDAPRRLLDMNNNNSNIITWQDPCIDMTTGKTDDRIASVLLEVKRWENIPDRQEPLTVDMIHYQNLQCNKNTPHSNDAVMYDWEVFGIYAGNRLSEWAQYDGKDIVENINRTVKAFTITDLKFFGENRRHMSFHNALQCPHFVHTIDVTWRFQKNGNNGEKKTFV
jgi:hypothetical protein